MGNDARQHGFEIERRADRLTDFAERFQFADGACQFVGSLIQFFEQPHVLDGDDRLVGEGLEKGNLLIGKRLDSFSADVDRTDSDSFAHQGHGQHNANASS